MLLLYVCSLASKNLFSRLVLEGFCTCKAGLMEGEREEPLTTRLGFEWLDNQCGLQWVLSTYCSEGVRVGETGGREV